MIKTRIINNIRIISAIAFQEQNYVCGKRICTTATTPAT
jgi:hypothetical protein